jgi:hypothetical protein
MATDLHTIRSLGGKDLPDQTVLRIRLGRSPGTVTAELRLPGQKSPAVFRDLRIERGVLTLPVPLVFLCYASEDWAAVSDLSQQLWAEGVVTWLDRKDLVPGDDWQARIEEAIARADRVIVCLSSRSVAKTGYVQREMKHAIDQSRYRPAGARYIIPLLLDDCVVPREFMDIQWLRFGDEQWHEKLLRALRP